VSVEAEREVARLEAFMRAILDHGAGVPAEEAERLLADAMAAAQHSPQPFRIEDVYSRLWVAVGRQPWSDPSSSPLQDTQDHMERCRDAGSRNNAPRLPGPLCNWFMQTDGTITHRHPGESRIDAAERVLSSYHYSADTASFDTRSEHCWRCDARGAETDDLRTP
jgi:hypothetical protein